MKCLIFLEIKEEFKTKCIYFLVNLKSVEAAGNGYTRNAVA